MASSQRAAQGTLDFQLGRVFRLVVVVDRMVDPACEPGATSDDLIAQSAVGGALPVSSVAQAEDELPHLGRLKVLQVPPVLEVQAEFGRRSGWLARAPARRGRGVPPGDG